MKGVRSSLVVGDRVVSRCDDGLLEVEYALFDLEDVIVAATLGFGVYEQGYLTTAGFARERMLAAGINPTLARDTFAALRAGHLRALARSPCVLRVIDQLTPYEGFEGGVYDAKAGSYAGAWLDLEALSIACPVKDAGLLFQALHLQLVVDEVNDDVPVRLLTAEATVGKRPGHRTWHRVPLEAAGRLPSVLRSMRIPARTARPNPRDDDEVRDELLHNLLGRSTPLSASRGRLHLHTLASRLARTGNTPPVGLVVTTPPPPGASAVPAAAKRTPVPPAPDIIVTDPLDPPSDPLPSFEQLEASTELLQGEEGLRDVAGALSAASAGKSRSLPDLAILAARSWLAAGEAGHARHLAKQVVENAAAPDNVRLMALEILDATSPTDETARPPPTTATIKPKPIVVVGEAPVRVAPPGASHPPFTSDPALAAASPAAKTATPAPPPPTPAPPARTPAPPPPTPVPPTPPPAAPATPPPAAPSVPSVVATLIPDAESGPRRAPAHDAPFEPAPSSIPKPIAPFRPGRVQILESLALPEGATEEMLAEGATPEDPLQMRIAMTRQARALGRDYRIWYGTTLQTSPIAIEAMQRHLRRRFDDGADERGLKKVQNELTRHGAALSEILARTLGAQWVDIDGPQPGHWSMVVPPDMRVWPIGRVYRFFQQGHREADLVAFYLDLETRSRSPRQG